MSTQSDVSIAGTWNPWVLGEHLCTFVPMLLLPWKSAGVRLHTPPLSQHQLTFLGFLPQDEPLRESISIGPLQSKLLWKGSQGEQGSPACAFPINFSPAAFAEALIRAVMIMRIFLCVAATHGVIPLIMLSSNLPEDQRVSSA